MEGSAYGVREKQTWAGVIFRIQSRDDIWESIWLDRIRRMKTFRGYRIVAVNQGIHIRIPSWKIGRCWVGVGMAASCSLSRCVGDSLLSDTLVSLRGGLELPKYCLQVPMRWPAESTKVEGGRFKTFSFEKVGID